MRSPVALVTTAPAVDEPATTPAAVSVAEVRRALNDSRALNAGLKRHWLRVVPHLRPQDRLRLYLLLTGWSEVAVQLPGPGRNANNSGSAQPVAESQTRVSVR